jgi:hypothetical protein
MKTIKRKDDFPSRANYIAKDGDGEKWFYEDIPRFGKGLYENPWWHVSQDMSHCSFYKYGKPTDKPEKKIWKIVD